MSGEVCEKHDDCMKDIREDLHSLDKSAAGTEGVVKGFIQATQDYINASREDIYGKGGLMDRVGNYGNQLLLQWGLLVVVLVAVVTKAIRG
jgi:hypothetical protein